MCLFLNIRDYFSFSCLTLYFEYLKCLLCNIKPKLKLCNTIQSTKSVSIPCLKVIVFISFWFTLLCFILYVKKNVYTIVFSLLLTQQRVSFFLPHSQQDTLQILKVSSVVLRIKAQESGCLGSNSVFTLANYVTLSALLNLPKPSFADLKLGIIVESTSQSYVKIKWKKAIEKEKTKHNTPLHGT